MEPWFSGTLWLSWSAEYCLLSVYKMRPKVSQIQHLKWVHGKCWCLICYSCSYRKSPPLLFPFLNYSEGIFLVFKEYIWFWHYLPQLLCSHLNTSCKSSTNNMEVSVELPLLFPDICMSKLIWLDWEDEETASSLHVMRNCNFFFWIRVLQLFWQHYTHPSVLPSFILPSVTAQMLELNCSVTVRQCVHRAVVFFYQGFQAQKSSRLNQADCLPQVWIFTGLFCRRPVSGNSDCITEQWSKFWCNTFLCSGAHIGSITVHCLFCYFPFLLILGPHCF